MKTPLAKFRGVFFWQMEDSNLLRTNENYLFKLISI